MVSLIHKYLRAGVTVNQKFTETEQGVPQGSLYNNSVHNTGL
jgi:hypothetical protein